MTREQGRTAVDLTAPLLHLAACPTLDAVCREDHVRVDPLRPVRADGRGAAGPVRAVLERCALRDEEAAVGEVVIVHELVQVERDGARFEGTRDKALLKGLAVHDLGMTRLGQLMAEGRRG